MNIQEYTASRRHLYQEFAKCVKGILGSALKNADAEYTVQQIQSRAKNVDSLSRKLQSKKKYESEDIEQHIKDLAGCRIIFYHNDGLNAFVNSGLVSENFDVDWEELKIHHPDSKAQSANDFYMANHYLVSLKPDRLSMPEFAKFAQLRCEIQVQTLLNHAWSETVHDITYKGSTSPGFGDRVMGQIDERLRNIMTKYLRPAGYEFQKVKHDFAQLMAGKEIFDEDVVNLIDQTPDTNTLFDLLERYKDYVLPNFSDPMSHAEQVYSVIEAALVKAQSLGGASIETPVGLYGGSDHADVLAVCLKILSYIRYLDFDRTHALLVDIYTTHMESSEKETYCECVEQIAAYHQDVIQKYGYFVQKRLIEVLADKPDSELVSLEPYVVAVCHALLTPTIEKTEWAYKEVTLAKINLHGTAELAEIRNGALDILERLVASNDPSARASALVAMRRATETPNVGNYDDALLNLVMDNTNRTVRILTENFAAHHFEANQANEERLVFFFRRAKGMLTKPDLSDTTRSLVVQTVALADQYRRLTSEVENYTRYKVLVGFRSVFEQEWDNDQWGWGKKEEFRNSKIEEFVESISEENIGDWIEFFSVCVSADSSDLATFQHFTKFLQLFASQKPELARRALLHPDAGLENFMHILLLGFVDAQRLDLLESVAKEFIDRGERLWECARPYVLRPLPNRELLHRVFGRAIELGNVPALRQVVAAVVTNVEALGDEIETLFIPALRALTQHGDTGWIGEAWFKSEAVPFLGDLDKPSAKAVLDNLVPLPELDYHAEHLIEPIAKKHPSLVLKFFGDRLSIENTKKSDERYDAIPYDFQNLATPLSEVPEQLVEATLSWFRENSEMFQYRGANLVSNTFPDFNDVLEQKLVELVVSGDASLLDFVTSILKNYKGQIFLHNVCREIVKVTDAGSRYARDVSIILEESGVLHGEYGFVERCERKKAEILYWLDNEHPKVRAFAQKYIRGLDLQRTAEIRRVEEDIELQKHQYE